MPKRTPEKFDYWSCSACFVDCMRVRVKGRRPKLCERCRTVGVAVPCSHCGVVVLRVPDRPRPWVACSVACRAALQHADRRATMTDAARAKQDRQNATRQARRESVPARPAASPTPKRLTAYAEARRRVWTAGQCRRCREWFLIPNKVARFCSADCLARYNREWGSRAGNHLSGAVRQQVFERDKGICQLCFESVDPTLPRGHRRSRTVDHIECQSWALIPNHHISNLRLAHLSCNASRGNTTRAKKMAA